MLKNIIAFHTLANSAVERTAAGGSDGQKITFNVIKQRLSELLYKITSQKFEDPSEGEEAIKSAPDPVFLCSPICSMSLSKPAPTLEILFLFTFRARYLCLEVDRPFYMSILHHIIIFRWIFVVLQGEAEGLE